MLVHCPDAKTMPTSVTGNIVCRCCLQVPGQPENAMVMGTGAYKPGYDSTVFRPVTDAGLCWLKAVMSCPGLHCPGCGGHGDILPLVLVVAGLTAGAGVLAPLVADIVAATLIVSLAATVGMVALIVVKARRDGIWLIQRPEVKPPAIRTTVISSTVIPSVPQPRTVPAAVVIRGEAARR